jgi:hypothetical protein
MFKTEKLKGFSVYLFKRHKSKEYKFSRSETSCLNISFFKIKREEKERKKRKKKEKKKKRKEKEYQCKVKRAREQVLRALNFTHQIKRYNIKLPPMLVQSDS